MKLIFIRCSTVDRLWPEAPDCCSTCHSEEDDPGLPLTQVEPPRKQGWVASSVVAEVCCAKAGFVHSLNRTKWAQLLQAKRAEVRAEVQGLPS